MWSLSEVTRTTSSCVFVTAGEGAHDVIGFEVVDAEKGDAEGLGDAGEVGHLGAEGLGHVGAGAFVVGEDAVAEEPPLGSQAMAR